MRLTLKRRKEQVPKLRQRRRARPQLEEMENRLLLSVRATLIKDLNVQPASSDPGNFLTIGAITYFSANDGVHGNELWRTDGTATGTYMVKDTNPYGDGNPDDFVDYNGELVFRGGSFRNQIWASDGTRAGTRLLKTFDPSAPQRAQVGDLTVVNGRAIFMAGDVDSGVKVWRTNGTVVGTYAISNIEPISALTVVGNLAFFAGYDPAHGVELWKTDGTMAGTHRVRDINPGPSDSSPDDLTAAGSLLFFTADDGVHGREVWRSDGTSAGTFITRDINPGSASSIRHPPYEGFPNPFTVAGDKVFFNADDGTDGDVFYVSDGTRLGTHKVRGAAPYDAIELAYAPTASGGVVYYLNNDWSTPNLWRSDGTRAGTYLVAELNYDIPLGTTANGLFFFLELDATNGQELWVTDGTATGTTFLQDFIPGPISRLDYQVGPRAVGWGATLYYAGYDQAPENGLWKTDGTPARTTLVADVAPRGFTFANGSLLFTGTESQYGTELWQSDGTTSGTSILKDINTGTLGSVVDTRNVKFAAMNGAIYFTTASSTVGIQLWKTNGAPGRTVLVAQVAPPPQDPNWIVQDLMAVGHTLFFVADGKLWQSDGTTAGTTQVTDLNSDLFGTDIIGRFQDKLYFSTGSQLWKTDGTAAGTVMVQDLGSSNTISATTPFVVAHSLLFFVVDGNQLWKSDGTTAGTTLVQTLGAGQPFIPVSMFSMNGELFYGGDADGQGWQLWKTDGTAAGTQLVAVLVPGSDAYPTNFVNVAGVLYFTSYDGSGGYDLWKSDGTTAGIQMVMDFSGGGSPPSDLVSFNNRLVFTVGDGSTTDALWQSDGTTAGTTMVTDIGLSAQYHFARQFTVLDGLLFFAAWDSTYGLSLWESDGTQTGTFRVHGIRREGPSNPAGLAHLWNKLFFFADDGIHGMEPWILAVTTASPKTARPVPNDLLGAIFATVRPTRNATSPVSVHRSPDTASASVALGGPHDSLTDTIASATTAKLRRSPKLVDALFNEGWMASLDGISENILW